MWTGSAASQCLSGRRDPGSGVLLAVPRDDRPPGRVVNGHHRPRHRHGARWLVPAPHAGLVAGRRTVVALALLRAHRMLLRPPRAPVADARRAPAHGPR